MPVIVLVALAVLLVIVLSDSGGTETVCGGTCMTLSYAQILTLATNAGFGDDAPTAAAIAIAESGGRTAVEGDVALGGSVGLWQIYTKVHTQWTPQQLTDPTTNAAAAFSIYRAAGNTFVPWTTYLTGAYKKYLPGCCGGCNCSACG